MSFISIDYADRRRTARDLTLSSRARGHEASIRSRGLRYASAYTLEELVDDLRRRASGEALACPGCGWSDPPGRRRRLYGVYAEKGPHGGIGYGYRLCKVCGFAQDADGGESYRVWLSSHECRPRGVPLDRHEVTCKHCKKTLRVKDGAAEPHQCGKYLRQGDPGYCCATCGEWQGPASARPLPGDRRISVRREESSAA